MGIGNGWQNLPFKTVSTKELLALSKKENLKIAVDFYGAFYSQIMEVKNHRFLNVS